MTRSIMVNIVDIAVSLLEIVVSMVILVRPRNTINLYNVSITDMNRNEPRCVLLAG